MSLEITSVLLDTQLQFGRIQKDFVYLCFSIQVRLVRALRKSRS
jgi:hypothetical protein